MSDDKLGRTLGGCYWWMSERIPVDQYRSSRHLLWNELIDVNHFLHVYHLESSMPLDSSVGASTRNLTASLDIISQSESKSIEGFIWLQEAYGFSPTRCIFRFLLMQRILPMLSYSIKLSWDVWRGWDVGRQQLYHWERISTDIFPD